MKFFTEIEQQEKLFRELEFEYSILEVYKENDVVVLELSGDWNTRTFLLCGGSHLTDFNSYGKYEGSKINSIGYDEYERFSISVADEEDCGTVEISWEHKSPLTIIEICEEQ